MKQYLCLTAMVGLALLGDWPSGQCADCLDNTGVHVDFPNPPVDGNHHGAVLFSGWRNGWCRTDVLCTGNSSVYLGDVRWRSDQFRVFDLSHFCSKWELTVFASDRAPTRLYSTEGFSFPSPDQNWLDAQKQVKVTLWEIDPDAWTRHAADSLRAKTIFAGAASGITLTVTNLPSPNVTLTPKNGSYYECDAKPSGGAPADGDPSRARQRSTGYDPASINVYYVSEVRAPAQAWTCGDANNPAGAWDVIFIGRNHLAHALAHELGHALGLNRTATLPNSGTPVFTGDIDELDMENAFGTGNLMVYGNTNPTALTIGQIYRMHFDARSWLNRGQAAVDNGYPRACQDSPVSQGTCPPLALSPPEGWP
jgi:hypothetical protein